MSNISHDIDDLTFQNDFNHRAMQAYKDYQQVGLHITLDEFVQWVDSLEDDTFKAMPLCHY